MWKQGHKACLRTGQGVSKGKGETPGIPRLRRFWFQPILEKSWRFKSTLGTSYFSLKKHKLFIFFFWGGGGCKKQVVRPPPDLLAGFKRKGKIFRQRPLNLEPTTVIEK